MSGAWRAGMQQPRDGDPTGRLLHDDGSDFASKRRAATGRRAATVPPICPLSHPLEISTRVVRCDGQLEPAEMLKRHCFGAAADRQAGRSLRIEIVRGPFVRRSLPKTQYNFGGPLGPNFSAFRIATSLMPVLPHPQGLPNPQRNRSGSRDDLVAGVSQERRRT